MTSLRNFTADRGRTERAEKRGGGAAPLSIDFLEAERGFEAASAISPEKEFEFRWATTLLQNAMDRVRESYEASGKADLFEGLKPLLSWNARSRPQHEVAAELGLSDSAMRVALHRLRSRFGDAVRELVSDTVSKPEEIDDEIQHLFRALSKG